MLLLLLLAQGTYYGSGPPPPPRPGATIFSYADYPAEALKNRWEGTVVADLTIDEQGAVRVCQIVQSSGHEILDEATCRVIITRARFKPATDKDGKPVKSSYRTPAISWKIR